MLQGRSIAAGRIQPKGGYSEIVLAVARFRWRIVSRAEVPRPPLMHCREADAASAS